MKSYKTLSKHIYEKTPIFTPTTVHRRLDPLEFE